MEVAEPSYWAVGWEALVAIGTVGLAVVTGYLALTTRAVARVTRDELSGQWRPVIAPAPGGVEYTETESAGTIVLGLVNLGRGPAFDVVIWFEDDNVALRRSGVVGAGDQLQTSKSVPTGFNKAAVRIRYRDLGGRDHHTTFKIFRVSPPAVSSAQLSRYVLEVAGLAAEAGS